jgi:hypothetical protein
MSLSIQEKADTVGTWRFICVRLMEMLASWVATSPEPEVKALFGQHIWELAQHANALGLRTAELRARLHYQRPPHPAYQDALAQVASAAGSGDRVALLHDVVLTDLSQRLRQYLMETDRRLDAPTIEVLEQMLSDFDHMIAERQSLAAERPDIHANEGRVVEMRRRFERCANIVVPREDVA